MHTNHAASAVYRMVERACRLRGGVLLWREAQRLVRRRCTCPLEAGAAKGCDRCRFTGFRGRLGVYELMRITPRVRSVVLARGSEDLLRRAAAAGGMTTMYQDGLHKAAQGLTTAAEVRSVSAGRPEDEQEGG